MKDVGLLKNKRILVVDDEHHVRQVLAQRLRAWGCRVFLAEGGEKGLRIAASKRPDLILLDILMPTMKGREVCALLKASSKTAGIPVIFLTALGLPWHMKAGLDLGAEAYIVKPFDAETLRRRIQVCLLRKERSR